MARGTQPYRAAFWSNQYQPRNNSCPCLAVASRGSRNKPRIELQSTATKIVTKLMNWNQYRVGTLLQRVHTDCLGRKFSPQRSQYTATLRRKRFNPAIAVRLLRLRCQKLLVRGSVLVSANLLAQKFGSHDSNKMFQATRGIESLRGAAQSCSFVRAFDTVTNHAGECANR